MEKKNLIVFDIDGTLTDSIKIHQKAFIEMLLEIGVENIPSGFHEFKHHTDSYIVKEIYETLRKEPFSNQKFIQFEKGLTEKIVQETISEIKGAKNLIEKLERTSNYAVCYATGSLRKAAEHKLKSIGVNFHEMQLVASDSTYEREKIVAHAIANAIAYYDVKKFERIISVGDGIWDLFTAKNLNLEFIGIGVENKDILRENGAEYVYASLIDFKV